MRTAPEIAAIIQIVSAVRRPTKGVPSKWCSQAISPTGHGGPTKNRHASEIWVATTSVATDFVLMEAKTR